jgi:ribosomal-protein-alanine N-acetyltransferase
MILSEMRLTGPSIALRYPEPGDAEALLAIGSDPEVTGWFSWGPYRDVEQPRAWIARQADDRESGRDLDLVVVHRDHGVVGVTGLDELATRDRRAMVGTWLGRAVWGTGVNAESKALIAHLAFAVCGLGRLGAYSNVRNDRSTAALERLGFVREGTLRRWHVHGDTAHDVHVFGLLREDWERSPLHEVPVSVEGEPPAAWRV